MEIITTVRPDYFEWAGLGYQYERVVALRCNDRRLGNCKGSHLTERRLLMSPTIGTRLMHAFDSMLGGLPVNCEIFSRLLLGIPLDMTETPVAKFGKTMPVNSLTEGKVGLINVANEGFVHSIGYGLGREGLQSLSGRCEIGFAENRSVLKFYAEYYQSEASLYEITTG